MGADVILHLGVIDQPYNVDKSKNPKAVSTGDVAEILENKYHVMEHFFQAKQAMVAGAMEDSVKGALETMMMGGPSTLAAFGTAESKIKTAFNRFLYLKEIEKLGFPGLPTKAALAGVNHRMKSGKNKATKRNKGNLSRPSLIDTGLYESSFKAWVD